VDNLQNIFDLNRQWAAGVKQHDPTFFEKLAKQQSPEYMWIGCADSRVPANQICGLLPGEVFVHRNVANIVVQTDFNCLSVLQFAVEALHVRHVIVCGHYGCGGVRAAMENGELGLIDNWLRNIKDVYQLYQTELEAIAATGDRLNRLCELNVVEQVKNVAHTTIVQSAWRQGRELTIHGWIYGLADGLLRDLNTNLSGIQDVATIYRSAGA
jgi:carbonic anhydrase